MVGINGISGNKYNVIDYTVRDDGLKFAGEYVDALNLSRMIGCFRDDTFVREIIVRLTAGISKTHRSYSSTVTSYSNVFGFNHIVYDSCYPVALNGTSAVLGGSSTALGGNHVVLGGYACYKPHSWEKGSDEKTMVPCLKRFLRGLEKYHAADERYVAMMKIVEDFRDE